MIFEDLVGCSKTTAFKIPLAVNKFSTELYNRTSSKITHNNTDDIRESLELLDFVIEHIDFYMNDEKELDKQIEYALFSKNTIREDYQNLSRIDRVLLLKKMISESYT